VWCIGEKTRAVDVGRLAVRPGPTAWRRGEEQLHVLLGEGCPLVWNGTLLSSSTIGPAFVYCLAATFSHYLTKVTTRLRQLDGIPGDLDLS